MQLQITCLNLLSDMVTKLSWIYLSICESRIWPLMWGLIYICKDWVQLTIAQILEKAEANQQVVNWNELSSAKPISSLVSLIHQSEPSAQIKEVLFLIIRTTCPKLLSLSPNIIGTPHRCSGPLLFITEVVSHLRGRIMEGKPEGLNPHGKKEAF